MFAHGHAPLIPSPTQYAIEGVAPCTYTAKSIPPAAGKSTVNAQLPVGSTAPVKHGECDGSSTHVVPFASTEYVPELLFVAVVVLSRSSHTWLSVSDHVESDASNVATSEFEQNSGFGNGPRPASKFPPRHTPDNNDDVAPVAPRTPTIKPTSVPLSSSTKNKLPSAVVAPFIAGAPHSPVKLIVPSDATANVPPPA